MFRQLQRNVDAVENRHSYQAQPGKMLHLQQGFFSKPPVAARHPETQAAKPCVRAERDARDAGHLCGKRIRHPVFVGEVSLVRHQIGGDDQPRQQHADIAHDAHETDGERGMRLQFFLDATFKLLGLGTELRRGGDFFRREKPRPRNKRKTKVKTFIRG